GDGLFLGQFRKLAHRLIQHYCDDSSMREPRAARIILANRKPAADAFRVEVQLEDQPHSGGIVPTTTKTLVGGLRLEFQDLRHPCNPGPHARARPAVCRAAVCAFRSLTVPPGCSRL